MMIRPSAHSRHEEASNRHEDDVGSPKNSHRSSRSEISLSNIVTVLFLFLISFVGLRLVYSLFQSDKGPAIVILGGGLTEKGDVPPWTQIRLDEAVALYQSLVRQRQKPKLITLSGGTPHKPNPTDAKGFPYKEATAAAQKLVNMGIPATDIYEEAFSLDTLGNVSIYAFKDYRP
jgi:uncharacterized SAM-binding protein YcdF (DUF218 family)